MKYYNPDIKVPKKGNIIKLYSNEFKPCYAEVIHYDLGQVCAVGIGVWKDDNTVHKFEIQLNRSDRIGKLPYWKIIN